MGIASSPVVGRRAMEPMRELADTAEAVCRLLLQAGALEERGYLDLADALRAQAAQLLARAKVVQKVVDRGRTIS